MQEANCTKENAKQNERKSCGWMDRSRIKHTFTNKKLTQPFANSNSVRCCDVICMRQTVSLRFLYIYSLGRLSFKIINSPGRLFLMEERRQYKIGHLLRGDLQSKQKHHQLSYISKPKPYILRP